MVKANRKPELAQKLLQCYLLRRTAAKKAPTFEAHVWMARLKAQLGDKQEPGKERAAAWHGQ